MIGDMIAAVLLGLSALPAVAQHVPRAQSTRDCRLAEGPGGRTVDATTGRSHSFHTAARVAIGARVGHNPAATAAVRQAVGVFLTETLRP